LEEPQRPLFKGPLLRPSQGTKPYLGFPIPSLKEIKGRKPPSLLGFQDFEGPVEIGGLKLPFLETNRNFSLLWHFLYIYTLLGWAKGGKILNSISLSNQFSQKNSRNWRFPYQKGPLPNFPVEIFPLPGEFFFFFTFKLGFYLPFFYVSL